MSRNTASAPPSTRIRFDGSRTPAAVVHWANTAPALADVTEIFDGLGLRVATHVVDVETGTHRFEFCPVGFEWSAAAAERLADAFEAAAGGRMDVDDYSRLIAAAGITWRDSVFVRAAGRYLRQAGLEITEPGIVAVLAAHPRFVGALVELFDARFRPGCRDRDDRVAAADAILTGCIHRTTALDADRLLRAMHSLVWAILRTNWFRTDTTALAVKLDPSLIELDAQVLPYREIFVHSPAVEGSHLRAGAIARGGLRWSDRPDDFRTEVLGLMKTQDVKNAVIVPMGAKGAFVVRGSDSSAAQVRRCYADFVGALLDVTDNIDETGKPIPPVDTVCYDEADPYLVVAADKGTAAFSDIANEIACARGYWLGDAFASGGRTGYDHKAMGITARGAWVSVERHCAELGIAPDGGSADVVTVVGIGDMSGDVFGNGMLRSSALALIGAFDHRHVFVDPNPDPVLGHAERARLAALPSSSWADYETGAISDGGGVWPRSAKSIPISAQIRERLGITAESATPDELIRALLCARVDLLWNGGIGTYVKALDETHSAAADPANDAVRVDAAALHCRMIGEGGNLGLTQRARIEFARNGGKLNADFIDNAAGVATSDREVNLKIALAQRVRCGAMSLAGRDRLLAEVSDEVAASVLADSARQVLAISLAELHAPFLLNRHEQFILNLEGDAGIDRASAGLPSPSEMGARRNSGHGLTRPEIAVLLALSKNMVTSELLGSTVVDSPAFASTLASYFPARVRDALGSTVREHRVAREIVAVALANDLVDRVGPGLIFRLQEQLGASTACVAAAYAVVRAVFDLDSLWNSVSHRTDTTEADRLESLSQLRELVEYATAWLLRHNKGDIDIERRITELRPAVGTLLARMPQLGGVPQRDLGTVELLQHAVAFAESAAALDIPIERVAQTFRTLCNTLGVPITLRAPGPASSGHWQERARTALQLQFDEQVHQLVRQILTDADPEGGTDLVVQEWYRRRAAGASRIRAIVDRTDSGGQIDNDRLCVLTAELGLLDSTRT